MHRIFLGLMIGWLLLSPIELSAQPAEQPTKVSLKSVDLRPTFDRLGLTIRSQGRRNTCSLFAVTSIAELEFNRTRPQNFVSLSEEFLVWAANEATGARGDQAMFYEALHGLNSLGICSSDLQSYKSNGRGGPSTAALADAKTRSGCWKTHWIRRWDVTTPMNEENFAKLKSALADGHAVACGLRWPRNDQGGFILQTPSLEDVYDGHSVAIIGYQDDALIPGNGVVHFRNSFGGDWGKQGYGQMSYDYFRTYVNDVVWLEYIPNANEKLVDRYEAESLEIVEQSNCDSTSQNMRSFGIKMWSDGSQLFCRAQQGARVDLKFEVPRTAKYRVVLSATAAPDYGTVQVSIDGTESEPLFDLYCGRVSPSGPLELGKHMLAAGSHRLQIHVDNKHPAAAGYNFGLDHIELYELP